MKAISIRQPWAWAIIHADLTGKDIENRRWWTSYRGPLLIHAGKDRRRVRTLLYDDDGQWCPDPIEFPGLMTPDQLAFGAIIGIVEQVDCRTPAAYPNHPHAEGPYCHRYTNPRAIPGAPGPIPYRGRLGLFNVPDDVAAEAMKRVDSCQSSVISGRTACS